MNISKREQRVLHVLAQGGCIRHLREDNTRRITDILRQTRDGAILADLDLALFQRLRRRGLIGSRQGAPVWICMQN